MAISEMEKMDELEKGQLLLVQELKVVAIEERQTDSGILKVSPQSPNNLDKKLNNCSR